MADPEYQIVEYRVLGIQRLKAGPLIGLAVVELTIAGVILQLQGVQLFKESGGGLAVRAPRFRDAEGHWRSAVILPDSLQRALADELFVAFGERASMCAV